MPLVAALTLSVGLAMDATAVAAAKGFGNPTLRARDAAKMALLFGAFQAGMPVLGRAAGARFAKAIDPWDHWVAFALLSGIGAKMIHDVFRKGSKDEESDQALGLSSLVVLAIATSIDALVAGFTLPILEVPIVVAASMIGITTAVLSAIGVYVGRRFGAAVGRRLDVFGGILLIGLGTKTLLEHLL